MNSQQRHLTTWMRVKLWTHLNSIKSLPKILVLLSMFLTETSVSLSKRASSRITKQVLSIKLNRHQILRPRPQSTNPLPKKRPKLQTLFKTQSMHLRFLLRPSMKKSKKKSQLSKSIQPLPSPKKSRWWNLYMRLTRRSKK